MKNDFNEYLKFHKINGGTGKLFKFKFSFPRQNKNFGGTRERLEKELTVQPKNCFLFVPFVTIVIPVENNEKTAVKFLIFFIILFFVGSAGETRTLMRLPSPDFESGASTIPPQRLKIILFTYIIKTN